MSSTTNDFPSIIYDMMMKLEDILERNFPQFFVMPQDELSKRQLKIVLRYNKEMIDAFGYLLAERGTGDMKLYVYVLYNKKDVVVYFTDIWHQKVELGFTYREGNLFSHIHRSQTNNLIALSEKY